MTRVRFAPSPTGYVHVGNLRTALYNYLFAKQNNGKYILRIEDTDQKRLVSDAVSKLLEAFDWVGITHDEGVFIEDNKLVSKGECGPYIQSERLDIYKKYVDKLVEEGKAYYCFCSKERLDNVREENKKKGIISGYDGHCRDLDINEARKRIENGESYVVRLKIPKDEIIEFDDLVRGHVKMNSNESDDQVLLKADGFPTYHMAVVVDDHLMGITHMIRAEEWLPSTPKQVVLYRALGFDLPKFVHLPNILNSEKKKLSKRHDSVAVKDFRSKGYLPEALINFLALIGWSPEDNEEVMDMDELIKKFSFDRVSKSGGVFDIDKLNWMNNIYIKKTDDDRLTKLSIEFLIKENLISENYTKDEYNYLKEIISLVKEKLDYLEQIVPYYKKFKCDEFIIDEDAKDILMLDNKINPEVTELLEVLLEEIKNVEFNDEFIKEAINNVKTKTGKKGKNLFMPIRVGITGEMHGSDLVKTIRLLSKERVIKRLEYIISEMKNENI